MASPQRPELRFNSGRGAVLCADCLVIVDDNFSTREWDVLSNLAVPCYCAKCNIEGWQEYNREVSKGLRKETDENK